MRSVLHVSRKKYFNFSFIILSPSFSAVKYQGCLSPYPNCNLWKMKSQRIKKARRGIISLQ